MLIKIDCKMHCSNNLEVNPGLQRGKTNPDRLPCRDHLLSPAHPREGEVFLMLSTKGGGRDRSVTPLNAKESMGKSPLTIASPIVSFQLGSFLKRQARAGPRKEVHPLVPLSRPQSTWWKQKS